MQSDWCRTAMLRHFPKLVERKVERLMLFIHSCFWKNLMTLPEYLRVISAITDNKSYHILSSFKWDKTQLMIGSYILL